MKQIILGLVSGLIGAIIGAYTAIRINFRNRKIAAIEHMLSLVYPIGFKSWHQPNEGKPALIFHDHYLELWAAYAALRPALPYWKRRGLNAAWGKYMVIEYYDQSLTIILPKFFRKAHIKPEKKQLREALNLSGILLNCVKRAMFP